jgi:hypothetical protein
MSHSSHSPIFRDISRLYVKDGVVIKNRDKDIEDTTEDDIKKGIADKNRVIIEVKRQLYIYFKDENIQEIYKLIDLLKNKYKLDIDRYINIM